MTLLNETKYQQVTCPRCLLNFTCMQSAACWCFAYSLPEKLSDYLEKTYDGCICPKCMNELLNVFNNLENY